MKLIPRIGLLFLLLMAAPAHAQSLHQRFVDAARQTLGTPYLLGGRLREKHPGIDCQGVLFYAAERVHRCGWKSYSVYPTVSVPAGELGRPVKGLSPISSEILEMAHLQVGDVLLLVSPWRNPAEPAIATLDGTPVWVLHTGVYSGEGRWIVGDHFAGKVVETDLRAYLDEHSDVYSGVYVTRMSDKGPVPRRCRQHPPMQLPVRAR
jgi:hypothetical protein